MLVLRALRFRSALAAVLLVVAASCAQLRGGESGGQFVVAAAHPLAVDAGYAVLERGGSALDAAIAVQLVLGLVEPESSGIGGGAFLLYWSESDKSLRSYDGRETAPAAARADRFLRKDNTPMDFVDAVVGGRSVGVPGVLRMLELAHARHGRLPWRELFQPAIAAAEEGFSLSPRLPAQLERDRFLPSDPAPRRLFYEDRKAKPAASPTPIARSISATRASRMFQWGASWIRSIWIREPGSSASARCARLFPAIPRRPEQATSRSSTRKATSLR